MNTNTHSNNPGMHAHPVLVSAQWQVELDEAIRRNDDAGMWDVVARQPDQEEAFRQHRSPSRSPRRGPSQMSSAPWLRSASPSGA